MTTTATAGPPPYPFLAPRGQPFTPVSETDRQRLSGPVGRVALPTGGWAWLVTRHADVRQMLRHPVFSADISRQGFPLLRELPEREAFDRRGAFIRMDGEEHARLRRMLTSEFMIKNVRRVEPLIQETVDRSLDAMRDAGPPADLVTAFALPVPSMVICHLLGVPYRDHAFFQAASRTVLDREAPVPRVRAAAEDLRQYLRSLIELKRDPRNRSDDLFSRLVTERLDTGELEPDEAVGMGLLLLVAGHETTANMIGLGTLLLLQRPEHWAALVGDQTIAQGLVEELLRYLTIVRTGLPRLAVADVEIGGQLIRAGEGAIAMLSMANRDDAAFADADQFVPGRAANQHLAFGFGAHQCLGQPLARAELRIAMTELARRFPRLRLRVPPAQVPLRDRSIVYGVAELPVAW